MADTATVYRGTTPTVTCTVDMDLTDFSCYMAFGSKAHKPYFVADNEQMGFTVDTSGEVPVSTLTYTLTQEQTLQCKAGKSYVQLRVIKDDVALATNWGELVINDIIEDGEIHDDYDTD